jgi:hypothetical protein
MTHTHFSGPPQDDLDRGCLVCLMLARGAELDAFEDQWTGLERDGHDDRQQWFAWKPDRTLIRPAVVDGISDILPGTGPVPLCWDHLAGLRIPKRPSQLANGGHFPPRRIGRG